MFLMTHFQRELEESCGLKLQLKINDNRSTMLSVRWEPDHAKVSLHRMFLEAPQNVMQSLACYIRREEKNLSPKIRSFIEENLQKLDYTHTVDHNKLCIQGNVYNLREMYNNLNEVYFDNRLKLFITWFGKHAQKNRSRITFGLYYDPLKLIKINRLLDNPAFPKYVVEYVIYHEMLHYVCPSYYDQKGLHRIHSKEFKQLESKFEDYERAQKWIREHHKSFFC